MAERQNPRKVSGRCNREPLIGGSQFGSAALEEIPTERTSCNIACEMNSWQPRQSHFDRRIITDKQELVKSFLEPEVCPYRKRMLNPIAYHLEQVEWAIFGTVTFRNDAFTFDNSLSEELRKNACRKLIGNACTKLRLRHRRLLYYGKSEWGTGHRGHYNFLIGKDGVESVTPSEFANLMQQLWVGGMYPQGTAVIEPFRKDLHKNGIRYQSKYEQDSKGNLLNNPEMFSYILWKRLNENAAWQN
jgi:hypothetical protein